ncbi:MAG: preprotein translocase subunit SecE [Syntrophobacterales bacterium]|nr:preprotein translocase subunit SecE [Syntrophobacterales bacterium]
MATKKPPKQGQDVVGKVGKWIGSFRNYLREVIYELKKVVWPSRKQTIGTTAIVVIVVMIFGVYLGIVDAIFSYLMRWLLG